MQLKIENVTKESKQAQGKTYWGIKCGNDWYNLVQDDKPSRGATINVDVKTTEFNGRTYRWATPAKSQAAPAAGASSNGKQHLTQAQGGMAFDFWAHKVDELPDWTPEAKASVLCTLMIATLDGKVEIPAIAEDEPELPPADDDIPF